MAARLIQLPLTPAQAFDAWPSDWPLAALWSGDPSASRSRWTVLARPSRTVELRPREASDAILPTGTSANSLPADAEPSDEQPPFASGWIGFLSYDLGRVLEPRARDERSQTSTSRWPISWWARCDEALIYDHALERWWLAGEPALVEGLLESARKVAERDPGFNSSTASSSRSPAESTRWFMLSALAPTTSREAYIHDVGRVLGYIRAGDIYQANLAHTLTAEFSGSSRALFAALAERARPWYGAYLELEEAGSRRAVLSLSPELFLSFDPSTRRVETRPMKGTRVAESTRGSSHSDLYASEKDRAELNMIIDLMRNDLGRVCDFGSVHVEQPRAIEQHGGPASSQCSTPTAQPSLLQATATISARLRDQMSLADLFRATFPGGSITGAPKIRAMQIIDELEPAPRGSYCGSIGFISDTGHAAFNIAIRTALITVDGASTSGKAGQFPASTLSYSVGAGIVADSSPEAEWQETLDKASIWSGLASIAGYAGTNAPSAAARLV